MAKPMLLENKMWLRYQMLRRRTIYDIGYGGIPTPTDFYIMERATVRGYGGYSPVPWVG